MSMENKSEKLELAVLKKFDQSKKSKYLKMNFLTPNFAGWSNRRDGLHLRVLEA